MSDERVKDSVRENFVFVRLEYESGEAEAFMDRAGRRGFPMMFIVDAAAYAQESPAESESGAGIRSFPIRWEPAGFASALESARS